MEGIRRYSTFDTSSTLWPKDKMDTTTFTSEPEWVDEILDPVNVAIEKQLKRKRWESPAAHNKRLRKLARLAHNRSNNE